MANTEKELSPFSSHKIAWKSYKEWRWYMEDIVKAQRQARLSGQEHKNLLGKLHSRIRKTSNL